MSETVAALLGLEQQLRKASDLAQLFYTLVNQTHSCVSYTQALLLVGEGLRHPQVVAVSDLPTVDYTSPYISWAERLAKSLIAMGTADQSQLIRPVDLNDKLAAEWRELELPDFLLWQPLRVEARDNETAGALLLLRDKAWSEAERGIAQHLAGSAGHALFALRRHQRFKGLQAGLRQRRIWLLAGLATPVFLALPVRLSTLAPVAVVPKAPHVVAAPLEGVVRQVVAMPNQLVEPGEPLVYMDDTELANREAVARQALSVARAELKTVQQGGFMDPNQKARLAELEAQVRLEEAEWQYAREQLERSTIKSDRTGVAVLDNPDEWKGRPVRVGERIMQVADPQQVEFMVMLPVKDSIALVPGAEVQVFLDNDPLHAWSAQLSQSGYEPRMTPDQQLAYRLIARLGEAEAGVAPPRIGLRGTAKVYGDRVSLFFYLFRRPITSVRQWLGW
ncbi:HlyD family efflux transporter periplasmic adaptor subunit [Marinobacterium sp. D7]|uniref:efflux RND transporter periplasmic adaptor subunit n=1 Tax=Marinobacterium ramblicola TaxID=2849041 RepID=UPI001C2D3887|nr:HlyD family efflux transporter periplasmic adaptor subunit [Marinobacterium ramblicola]